MNRKILHRIVCEGGVILVSPLLSTLGFAQSALPRVDGGSIYSATSGETYGNVLVGDASGDGTVNVNGVVISSTAGTSWDMNLEGTTGAGTVHITNGGVIDNSLGSYAHICYTAGVTCLVTIDGSKSGWTQGGDFYLGNGGNGQLEVLNGGALSTVTGDIQIGGAGNATATVSGGSALTSGRWLGVGVYGTGTLTIDNSTVSSTDPN